MLRRNRLRQGGCFKHMKVLFLLEKEMQKAAYTDVIKAGGGTVLEDWDIDLLLKYKPGKHFPVNTSRMFVNVMRQVKAILSALSAM